MNLLDQLEEKGYKDRVDVSMDISLFEYGIIRNPKTERVIYYHDSVKRYDWTSISVSDVKEALEEVGEGFYSFIGSNKEDEMKNLDNDNLTTIIMSLNQYSGYFNDTCNYNYKLINLI